MIRPHEFLAILMIAAATPAPAQEAGMVTLTVVNHGTAPIKELFVTPAGDANWGQSRLKGQAIAPGAGYTLRRKAGGNCLFDVRVVAAGGKPEDHRGVNICKTTEVAVGAGDASFRLINRGAQAVTELYATPSGQETFGQNRLVGGTIPPGAEREFKIVADGNCIYDLKVVFADKTTREKKRADLCKITDLPVQ